MKTFLAIALLFASHAAERDDYQPAIWSVDARVLSCTPETLSSSDVLVLHLGPGHGSELAIRRVTDDAWYFLVVRGAPDGAPQLMTPEAFAVATRVAIPASFETRGWLEGASLERVFAAPGRYEVHVSDILESEEGGHICSIDFGGVAGDGSSSDGRLRGTPSARRRS